ncbi:MAG: DEAD/DEAH box helicase [Burkholderiaceae bacterium]|jgi:superfamily II DNA/RNA helicase|nr:DEAD/DEAH box helicase [Burkholderiaceae bacterium]
MLDLIDFAPAEAAAAHEPLGEENTSPNNTAAAAAPSGFASLGLARELLEAVAELGFSTPTPVQAKTIPLALSGHTQQGGQAAAGDAASFVDLMVSSQTGSGKTAAFLLPMLHTLLDLRAQKQTQARADAQRKLDQAAAQGGEATPPSKKPRRKNPMNPRHFQPAVPGALVLCPTRELAQQVARDAIDLVRHCRGLRVADVVGGMPYPMQIARLQNADLVVATPGRLLDLQRSGQIVLENVRFLVVDEADRMLDLGFADDLAEIHRLTATRQQTMMFSATFAPRVQQLAARVMRAPQKIQIDSPQERHSNIQQLLHWADSPQHKRRLLDHWLRESSIDQAVVFASTQIECDALAHDLQQVGFSAVALHGALNQGLRNRRLQALRQGRVQFLVATDVAARGIDVPTISHVFNYGLPMKAEDYTHRIGRTGRAGRQGLAVSFAEFRDRRRVFDIEDFTRQTFDAHTISGLEPQERAPTRKPPLGKGKGKSGFGGGGAAGKGQRRRAPGPILAGAAGRGSGMAEHSTQRRSAAARGEFAHAPRHAHGADDGGMMRADRPQAAARADVRFANAPRHAAAPARGNFQPERAKPQARRAPSGGAGGFGPRPAAGAGNAGRKNRAYSR